MFIDETWAKTNMGRTYGRAPRGERLRMGFPHGHWKTTTFVGALTMRGMIAPFVLTGAINRDAFDAYVEKVLVPELRPGDIVIMDNLSSHKGPRTDALIKDAGASLLFLPPYSPDFNPIEKAFAKLKALCSAKPPSAPSKPSGPPSAASPTTSPQPSAQTTSEPADTIQTGRIPL